MSMRTKLKTVHIVEDDAANDYEGKVRDFFPEIDINWGDGTTANNADKYYCDTRTPGAATSENLDLTALTPGPNAGTVSLAEVRLLAIHCPADNDDEIELKAGASNGWTALFGGTTDPFKVAPGTTAYLIINGADGKYPVSGTNKTINVNNPGGADNSYTILIVGPSA